MKKSEISSALDMNPFRQLFAFGSDASINTIGSEKCGFTHALGISTMYSDRHGKKVSRADVNGYGRMITESRFFNECGGYYTFSNAVSDAIGGYPLGAVLHYADPSTGKLRMVRSMIADNKNDFVSDPTLIDGECWSYVDQIMPVNCRPKVFPDWSDKNEGTISVGDEYVVLRDELFIIQTGPDQSIDHNDTDSEIRIWINVKSKDNDAFHSAGLLAYYPPVSSSYDTVSVSDEWIDDTLMKKATFTSFYASSPIQVYLSAGDIVKITSDLEMDYSAKYVSFRLKSS